MALGLHNLSPKKKAKRKKRVGRGLASKGTYSGRGRKGQKARSGVSGLVALGMKRQIQSIPKLRGFKSMYPSAAVVNVGDLEKKFDTKTPVTRTTLKKFGYIRKATKRVKLLGNGEVKIALIVHGLEVSATAKKKIEAAGGKVE